MMTQQVHQCEFCGDRFQARPQVKNPRACSKSSCQQKRQRSNELEWRQRNPSEFDSLYHKVCKDAREKQIREIAKDLKRCLETGARFIGKTLSESFLEEGLFQFLTYLGIRKINKFWTMQITQ
jgi:hypothetical protein